MTGRFDEATAVLDEAIARPTSCAGCRRARHARAAARRLRTGDAGRLATASASRRRSPATMRRLRDAEATRRASRWPTASSPGRRAPRAGSARPPIASERWRSSTPGAQATSARSAVPRPRTPRAASLGPTHVDEAIARCESCLEQTAGDRQSEGNLLAVLAGLYAMQGAFDHARELVARARALLSRSSASTWTPRAPAWRRGGSRCSRATSRRRSGSFARSYDALDAVGERYVLSTVAGLLAQTLLERGAPLEEASASRDRSQELATDDDVATQAAVAVRPRPDPRARGEHAAAEALDHGRRSRCLAPTDADVFRLEAELDLGETSWPRRRTDEARVAYEAARGLAERKGGVVLLGAVLRAARGARRRPRVRPGRAGLRHQLHGPFVFAWVTIVQIFGLPFGGVIETTQPSVFVRAVRDRALRQQVVVEHLRDLVLGLRAGARRPRP